MKYMVQVHDASHLHDDLRLEIDGVYKSWALPKGFPTLAGESKLAVPTPDHSLDYLLEGTIDNGYGKGTIMLWDYGLWTEKDPITDNKINFYVQGERVEGYFTLIKTGDNWLLISHFIGLSTKDAVSILTGRNLEQIANHAPIWLQKSGLVSNLPVGDNWLYEPKYDGYRCYAEVNFCEQYDTTTYPDIKKTCVPQVKLYSRGGQDWTTKYPHIVDELKKLEWSGRLDGEIIASSFDKLHASEEAPVFMVFDIPGTTDKLPDRKENLSKIIKDMEYVKLGEWSEKPFDPCAMNLEGSIAKNKDCSYSPNDRSCWAKYKCKTRQEFVIGGYKLGKGRRANKIGALLVGYYGENDEFIYAGKVGTGLSNQSLDNLSSILQQQEENPFEKMEAVKTKNAVWVKPTQLVEVEFLNWTRSGHLRIPSYVGLRSDKSPLEVIKEVEITHPSKLLFPKYSKMDVAQYYKNVAPRMVPEVQDRPLTLYRCPDGIEKPCFWQRNAGPEMPGLRIVDVEGRNHYVIANEQGLQSLAQLNVVEIHTWNNKVNLNPDRLIFDLDPKNGASWDSVVETAKITKIKLEEKGYKPYIKTSGKAGLHIVVPVTPDRTHDELRLEAKNIAEQLCSSHPNLMTCSSRVKTPRVYIDWLRNDKGSSLVAPWSLRATPNAIVSTPISWDELPTIKPEDLNIDTSLVKGLVSWIKELVS